MFNPTTIVLRTLLFSLLVFAFLRVSYLVIYPEYFGGLRGGQVLQGLLFGVRFDLSIAATVALVFFLPLLWPGSFRAQRQLTALCLWLVFIMLVMLWLLNIGDLVYFGEVFRHAGREVLLLSEDYGMLLELAAGNYRWPLLAALLAVIVLAIGWQHGVVRPSLKPVTLTPLWSRVGKSVVAMAVIVLAIRGLLLDGKPIGPVDAYALNDERAAALSLNGAFAIVHNTRRAMDNKKSLQFFTDNEFALLEQEYFWHESDPFIRAWGNGKKQRQRNVVIVLLESWSYQYIDGLAGTSYGATPFFDSLMEESRVWINAFAAGQRSIEGIQAALTSVPLLSSHPVIGWGLEQNRITRLADILDSRGYESVMVQSSNRRSYHMDSIAGALGFNEYFGKEDIPLLRQYPVEQPRFGWDYETLMFLANHLENRQEPTRPFTAFAFTGTTHDPFPDPGEEFHVLPHTANTEGAYLNTLRYSDWALEQFMQRMSKQSWYDNTVFVFMADHVLRASSDDLYGSFRIPLVIYTPGGFLSSGKENRFASQYDLLPTLMTLLGVDDTTASFGHSLLLPKSEPEGVFVQRGDITGWLEPEGWFTFNASSLVEVGGVFADNEPRRMNAENWLKARLQLADWRLKSNLWVSSARDRL